MLKCVVLGISQYPQLFTTTEGSERVAQAFEAAAERMEKEASDG